MEKFLTVRQLQEQLQVDRITIYRMLGSGRLTGVKVGGQWRFREEDVASLLAPGATRSAERPAGQAALPLPCLHAMQELFSEATGVAALIVDPQGQQLTDITRSCAFCKLVLSSDEGRRRCTRSWAALAGGTNGTPRMHTCHAGLGYAHTTIHVDGRPLATVIAGQVVTENGAAKAPSLQFAELAEACSVPLSLLNDAYAAVRRLDHEGQARVLHLLGILGVAACRIGNERQRLVAKLDRIAQITMEN